LQEKTKTGKMKSVMGHRKERSSTGIILLIAASIILFPAMFILPFINEPAHSLIRNTLSQLGAQSSRCSWIMNSIILLLSFSSLISGWECFKGFSFHRFILVLFAVSLALSAIFNNAPETPDTNHNISEAGWQLYFSSTAWLTFIILAFSTATVLENQKFRHLAIFTGLLAILLMLLVTEAPETGGNWERLLFIISVGWMISTFRMLGKEKEKKLFDQLL